MKFCIYHKHSSKESATLCYNKNIGKRADKRIERNGGLVMHKYRLIKYSPPLPVKVGNVIVYYFFRGELTR